MKKHQILGQFLTPSVITKQYIIPLIKDNIYNYVWTDLYAGEGNLIFPILDLVPNNKQIDFFKEHLYLYDIDKEMILKLRNRAKSYNIPDEIINSNIILCDTIKKYPIDLLHKKYPVFHITNPPYLYRSRAKRYKYYKEYFDNNNYSDLYQLAMVNDLKNNVTNAIYILPTNFLFSTNMKIRTEFLFYYDIVTSYIFEFQLFEQTGWHTILLQFRKKKQPIHKTINFTAIRIHSPDLINNSKKEYVLNPPKYKPDTEFSNFVHTYQNNNLSIKYCFEGRFPEVIESEQFNNSNNNYENYKKITVLDIKDYKNKSLYILQNTYDQIKNNILCIKTIDSSTGERPAGIYNIKEIYNVDVIWTSIEKFRTQPMHIFFTPQLSISNQLLLQKYFMTILEYFRRVSNSDFMTTFKYTNNSNHVRKYLGLLQASQIIHTYPHNLSPAQQEELNKLLDNKDIDSIFKFLKEYSYNNVTNDSLFSVL